jgi:hypothetical protein
MKRAFYLTLLLVLAAPCLAWADAPDGEAAKLAAAAAPVVDNVLAAIQAHDYDRVRKDFADDLRKSLSADRLAAGFAEAEKKSGPVVGKELAEAKKSGGVVHLVYTLKMTKAPDFSLRFTFKDGDPSWKIQGLWIGLREDPAKPASNDESDAIVKAAKPVIDNFLAALKDKDYARLEKDYSVEMLKAQAAGGAKKAGEAIEAKWGPFVAAEFDRVETTNLNNLVYYRVSRAKMTTMLKLVFAKDDPTHRIAGVWEKPANPGAIPFYKAVKPVVDRFFAAWAARDYAAMGTDFDAGMRAKASAAELKYITEKDDDEHGAFESAEFDWVEEKGDFMVVHFRVNRVKSPTWLQLVFRKGDPAHQISGWWEGPL